MEFKREEAGIFEAAEMLGLQVVVVETPAEALTTSPPLCGGEERSLSLKVTGVESVSEAAALAAAGEGARLAGQRIAVGRVTCAIAFGASRLPCISSAPDRARLT